MPSDGNAETVVIIAHSVFGGLGTSMSVLLICLIARTSPKVIENQYRMILLTSSVTNFFISLLLLLLQPRVYLLPNGSLFVVLGPARFLGFYFALTAFNAFTSLVLLFYMCLAGSFAYRLWHVLHPRPPPTLLVILAIGFYVLIAIINYSLTGILYYESEGQVRQSGYKWLPVGVVSDRLIFGTIIHESLVEVVANFFGALILVPSFSAMLFVRHRILVQLRRTEQRLRSVDRSILRALVIQAILPIPLIFVPSVLNLLIQADHALNLLIYLFYGLLFALNPIISIFVIKPYRKECKNLVRRPTEVAPAVRAASASVDENRIPTVA